MRTTARIAIIFVGAVILTEEIATPSAHADRGLAGGKDFEGLAYRDAALLPWPQQGPIPQRQRQSFATNDAVIAVSSAVRALPTLSAAQRQRPFARPRKTQSVTLAFGGQHAGNEALRSERIDPYRFVATEEDSSDGGRKAFHQSAL